MINYTVITELKKSSKGNIYLAAVEGYDFPAIVKEIYNGNISVFRALQDLENDHLPQIYQVEEIDKGLLVVEEYIEGNLLSDYISNEKLTEAGCFDVVEQLGEALSCLHNRQPPLIHRDIKPSNIIISSGGLVKLIDFDSTRIYKEDLDTDTRLLGTEKYAAPEQYGFSQTDCRSDIYSLGVVLDKLTSFISSKRQKSWKKLVEKCTSFSPEGRFQSVYEIRQEMVRIRKDKAINWSVVVAVVAVFGLVVVCLLLTKEISELKSRLKSTHATTIGDSQTIPPKVDITEKITTESPSEYDENMDEKFREIPPEYRDLQSDTEQIINLKNEIRNHNAVVIYCFKDRLQGRGFLHQENNLDRVGNSFIGIKLYSQTDGRVYYVEPEFYKVNGSVISIDNEYIQTLEDGYYMLSVEINRNGTEHMESSIFLYVSPRDILTEPNMWLQYTTFDYNYDRSEAISVVVRNDSSKVITSLSTNSGMEVDASFYTIGDNGKSMIISKDLIGNVPVGGAANYIVNCSDGSSVEICINGT